MPKALADSSSAADGARYAFGALLMILLLSLVGCVSGYVPCLIIVSRFANLSSSLYDRYTVHNDQNGEIQI